MPAFGIEPAATKQIDGRAGRDRDICDNKAGVMCWHHIVYGVWEGAVSRVEEPDKEQSADACDGELAYCPGL